MKVTTVAPARRMFLNRVLSGLNQDRDNSITLG